jgi:penicillin V acylase-like amidase (Ntn superfamily)
MGVDAMNVIESVRPAVPRRVFTGLMLAAWFLLLLATGNDALACSSFLLEKDGSVIAGRNLDSNKFTPGVVVVNHRGIWKESRSWDELAYGRSVPNAHLSWVSKYGSITFNTFCRDFVDGGMNEAGLFIQEMSLVENKYPEDPAMPRFFMMLWMQYILDNFESVDQVVASAREVVIDGWNWHFFAADAEGNTAAIEFVDGKPVLTYSAAMPITVLCNETYETEMDLLRTYKGFGGDTPVVLKDAGVTPDPDAPYVDDRFVNAATLIKMSEASQMSPLDYGMKVLDEMAWDGTQWSYVCDLTKKTVRYRTKDSPELKELRFSDFNFDAAGPTRMLDIHATGDIGPGSFSDYSLEFNRASLVKKISGWESVFSSNGATLEGALDRISGYSETTKVAQPQLLLEEKTKGDFAPVTSASGGR